MRREFLALCFVVVCAGFAAAGPVLDWIRDNRPGILIPKRPDFSPSPRPIQPQPIGPIGIQPGCPTCPTCPGGVCPVPGGREFRTGNMEETVSPSKSLPSSRFWSSEDA